MRVVFFGTAEFAVPTLEHLISDPRFEVACVLTQPDRPQGRGQKLTPPPVKQLALQHGLPVWQPERLRKSVETLEALAATEADFFVVAAYGQILPQSVLDLPARGSINVHGSLLPRYRGAAPIQWAIYNGETETGITTMLMEAGLDTGAMLLKARLAIPPDSNSEHLIPQMARVGGDLLVETLLNFDLIIPEPQNDAESTYAPLIDKQQYLIDWSRSAVQIHNQIRAFYPYAHTLHRGNRLRILKTEIPDRTPTQDALPGGVINLTKSEGFSVATGEGELLATIVQPAGGRAQPAWDYANGNRLEIGEQLGS